MVRFDPLGRFLVSTPLLAERFARVWDLATGAQVAALEHANAPTSAQFTPDGDNVLTTGTRNLFLWNVGSWSRPAVTMVGHHVTLRGASINADSTRAVSWDDAGIGRVWRLDTGAQITMLIRHENSVESAVFARDGTTVLTASSDLTARIWTGTISELRTSLVGHRDRVVSAVYAPDRESILTASTDGTARIWQSLAEPLLAPLGTARHEGGATALDVSRDGTIAASGGADGRILIWRTRGGLRRALEQGGRITAVRFSADGKLLCTASSNGTIRLWRVADGTSVRTIDVGSAVRTAALSPDGRWIAAAAGRFVLVYGVDGARRGVVSHDGDVRAVSFAPNGARVLSGGGDADARLSNLDGTVVARLGGHEGPVTTVAYSPDGKLVATGSEDGVLRVWPSSGVGNAQELEVAGEPLTSVRFDARSTRIVAATDEGQIRSWTLGSNPKMTAYQGHVSVVNDARFSPDGRWIVSAGPTAAGVFFVASGKRVYLLRGHGQLLTTATFTKDSRRIVSAGTDGTVRTFVCAVCGSLDELRALAKRRLAQIDRIG
jgi:WD40 repeat protein